MLYSMLLCLAQPIEVGSKTVKVGTKSIAMSYVRANLAHIKVEVGVAQRRVGMTEDLGAIAKRYGAVAGINGSFFEAYNTDLIKSPNHTLVTHGRFLHVGGVGTLLGFSKDNAVKMEHVEWTIKGSLDHQDTYPNNWFAYWINRAPSASTVTIYTPDWGQTTGLDGQQVVVRGGKIVSIQGSSALIPADGFVVYARNAEESMMDRFRVGLAADFKVEPKTGDRQFWTRVYEAVGAGPRLVHEGKASLDPISEGFSSPKILSMSGARSLVGADRAGNLWLVASSGTVREMASLMLSLGCTEAMNLDGGASSGLWTRERYIRKPGRAISNALLILPK